MALPGPARVDRVEPLGARWARGLSAKGPQSGGSLESPPAQWRARSHSDTRRTRGHARQWGQTAPSRGHRRLPDRAAEQLLQTRDHSLWRHRGAQNPGTDSVRFTASGQESKQEQGLPRSRAGRQVMDKGGPRAGVPTIQTHREPGARAVDGAQPEMGLPCPRSTLEAAHGPGLGAPAALGPQAPESTDRVPLPACQGCIDSRAPGDGRQGPHSGNSRCGRRTPPPVS